jgi:sec-independent protein translocase protein TatA
MPNIGPLELVIVLLIVLVVFGPKRLPGLGRQLGSGMREFKDAITGKDKDEADQDERPAAPVRAALGEGTPQAQPDTHATPAPESEALRQPAPPPGA